MSGFNISDTRKLLQEFDFNGVFVEGLGWEQPERFMPDRVSCDGREYERTPVASLSGVMVFELLADDGQMPDGKVRLALERQISQHYNKNLLIFVNSQRTHSVWYWVKREGTKRYPRSHHYVSGQSGDLFLSKIGAMFVDISELDEDGNVPVARVAQNMKEALDIERVTKKFYNDFQEEYQRFLAHISGIENESERRWYVSVILNRIMFVYFLQSKGFIDHEDLRYLQNKLDESQTRGPDRYYDEFLEALFFEGFAKPPEKRSASAQALLGDVKYLNGGLFLPHPIEERWPNIAIPDVAFEQLFALFERYSWHLDDTVGGRDDQINPDVLGYIFEKYINQKAFGAYYTRPEITQYLCEHTIHQLVLDNLAELSVPVPGLPAPPVIRSIGDLWSKMSNTQCRLLLQEVLPKLSLLDPACGSGAFLVAAMKTLFDLYRPALTWAESSKDVALQQWLAQVDRDHPSRDYFIKKQIITNNLFGVDIMEEAVEIARLRLFLALVSSVQRAEQLEPLPNIDFNILPGNSLFGLLRVSQTVYNGRLGEASYATLVAKKNQLVQQYRHATEIKELKYNPIALTALRQTIEEHRQSTNQVLNGILLDEFRQLKIKFEEVTWDTKKNKKGKAQKRALTIADIDALRPFHWGYEFDEVMNVYGGFDVIITNPPWEIFKPQAKEFFAEYSDVVTKNNMTIKEFKKKQKELLRQADIREAWLDYLSRFPHQSKYFRKSDHYQHQRAIVNGRKTGSDINLYKLFLEQCYHLLREGAPCGIVIPSGIYTDLGATGLRQMLFDLTTVDTLFGLSNEKFIFENVHHAFKFTLLVFKKGGPTENFQAAFRINPREAIKPENMEAFLANNSEHMQLSVPLTKQLSPETWSVMEFNKEIDIQIAEKMTGFPLLGEEIEGVWNLSLTREFDMTQKSASHLVFEEPKSGLSALYEGKMIWHFDHRFGKPRFWGNKGDLRKYLLGKSKDDGQILNHEVYRVAFRRQSASTNTRTLVSTIIPPAIHADNLASALVYSKDGKRLLGNLEQLFFCAVFNSFVLDYCVRQRVTNNLNFFYLYQLSVPRLTPQDWAFAPIVERAAKLICTTPEFDDLAQEVGLGSHANGATDESERATLRAELDGLIAHVYGLSDKEFRHILSTFPVVDDVTKQAALEAYRQLVPNPEVLSLIASGESERVEFKEGAIRNPHKGKRDDKMRDNILKAVAALMNTPIGGTLLIGVADDGTLTGVEVEYAIANKQKTNWDGYELFLIDMLNKSLSISIAFNFYTISRHTIQGKEICRIQVRHANQPVYVQKKLYVRSGAQSKELQGPDLIAYVQTTWPK